MNAEKVNKAIGRAIELTQSIHNEIVDKFTADGVDSAVMIRALEITSELTTLEFWLEYISEEVQG